MVEVRFAVGAFEHVDHVVSYLDGVEQGFEIEGMLLDVGEAQVVRDGAEGEDDVIVGQLARSSAFDGDSDAALVEFHFGAC